MSQASQNLNLLDQFKDTPPEALQTQQATFRLTPHLVLAAALLHMMASDGTIEEAESSQLQAVLGGDQHVLNVAVQYVQAIPLAQFLTDAVQVLDKASTLCVLTNVCDSLLADGRAGAEEVALFERMKTAWGIDTASFAPYEKTIALKNNASVMGQYQADQLSAPVGNAHLALGASLLYMMAADGNIATEEIGQLQTVIGEFKGLQEAALKQVRSVKLPDFLKRIAPNLSADVKLYILTNVCDSMMADGDVDALESKIFQTMLAGYGYDSASFKPYYQSIKVKNIKTFSASVLKPKLIYSNVASGTDSDEIGLRFSRDNSFQEEAANAGNSSGSSSTKGPVLKHVLPETEGAHGGNRTMQDNINKVTQGFGDEDRVHQIQENALANQSIPLPKAAGVDDNIQTIQGQPLTPAAAGPVLRPIAATGTGPALMSPHSSPTHQPLPGLGPDGANVIGLPGLAMAEGSASQPLANAASLTSPVKLSATAIIDHAIPLATSANEDHLEKLPSTKSGLNLQAVSTSALSSHRQALPSTALEKNRQATPTPAPVLNRQALPQDGQLANQSKAPTPSIGTHRAKLPDNSVTRASTLIDKRAAATPEMALTAARTVAQKANRVKLLSDHVSQLRLKLDQLAGLNHAVLAAAQQAAGGPCTHCGNPQCLFTHHVKAQTG